AAELEREANEEERLQREDELRRFAKHLARAQKVGRMGSVEVDLATGKAGWSAEIYTIFGLDPAQAAGNLDQIYALGHPDDRLRIRELRQQDELGLVSRPCEYRLVRPDGQVRWIYRQCELVMDASGKPARLIITHQDVTDRENYRRVMSTLNRNVGNLIGQ